MKKDKLKGFISGVLLTSLVFAGSVAAFGASGMQNISVSYANLKVYVNGLLTPMTSDGQTVEPFMYAGRTYVPLKAVSEALGKTVTWDGANKAIYIGSEPSKALESPFTLNAGQYIVGEDIVGGKYDCIAVKGSGNFTGKVKALGLMGLNEILAVDGDYYKDQHTYSNLRLVKGDTIKVGGDLQVKFTLK